MKSRALLSHPEPLETRIAPAFVTGVVNLAGLNGTTGSEFHGALAGDLAGISVSAAGDVNGDGFGDFIIGASQNNIGNGEVSVIFGTAAGFPAEATLDAAFLDGTKGFRLLGQAVALGGERAGSSVSAAGDVNGDGFDDVIVGAPYANPNGNASGAAYVVFGQAGGFAATVPLASLDGSNGFKLSGAAGSDRAGTSVSGAGDVNRDGFADVIVGAPGAGGTGAAYIIYGKAGGFAANLTLSGLTAAQGTQLDGRASGSSAGLAVSGAGDVNGDGFDDVVVGAPLADQLGNDERGEAYVVFGGSALPATIALGGIGGSTGFRAQGSADKDYAGTSVGAAGDVNGDGLSDVIVGARRDGAGGAFSGPGEAYVIFGNTLPFGPVFPLGTTSGTIAFTGAAGDVAGFSVKGAGDVNGDGIDDLIAGAPQVGVSGGTGGAYVVFGRANLATTPPLLSALDGSTGFRLGGEEAGSGTGRAVSGAGDVNGDGFADLLVGAPFSDDGGTNKGQAYLVLGGPSGALINPTITAGKTATWTDVDGDLVTLKVSKGTLTNANFQLLKASATAPGAQLLSLTLGPAFDGADVSITAKRAGGGDGRVNVGFINATDVDLGKVTVGGDLGRIAAGDADDGISLKSLTVGSMGVFGGRTADTGTRLSSVVIGAVGPVKIAGDVQEADLFALGSIGSITIGGSVVGGATMNSGRIVAVETVGAVKISGDVRGGRGDFSAFVQSLEGTASVTVGGSLIGGAGDNSGALNSLGPLGSVTIGGSQIGGGGANSGAIAASGSIGKVLIQGDQIGGSALGSGALFAFGAGAGIGSVTIGGDARAGTKAPSLTVFAPASGGIGAQGALGTVTIRGDVLGTAEVPYVISGGGPTTGTKSVAIASLKVAGDFEHALVLGGYGHNFARINGHAQTGAISVGGDWVASSVSAGLLTSAGAKNVAGSFGNGDDAFINDGPNGVVASIKSVTIKGAARGTFADGDRFAIVAEQIGRVSIGGVKLPLTKSAPGADPANDLAAIHVGATPDFVVREISRTAVQPTDPVVTPPAAGPRTAIPGIFNLGALAGGDGFTLSAVAADDYMGDAVSRAGDVNGDGFDDFLIGANTAAGGGTDRGAAYVVFGTAGGFPTLGALNGTNGFKLSGAVDEDFAGAFLAAAGDVNGDGFDDVLVTSVKATTGTNRGMVHVVFGRADFSGTGGTLNLGGLDGAEGFRIPGLADSDFLSRVAAAGDVNGDGFDDVFLGAPNADEGGNDRGAAYLIFGGKSFVLTAGQFDLATLDGVNGFKVPGLANYDVADRIGSLGDINGDGFDDLSVGSGNAVQVILGAGSFAATGGSFDVTQLDGTNGFKVTTTATDSLTIAGGVGDVNGDGFEDFAVRENLSSTNPGRIHVIFGKASFAATAGTLPVETINGTNGFQFAGLAASDNLGRTFGAAGDMNGDGYADLFAASARADGGGSVGAQRGEVYVIFGKASFTAAAGVVSLAALDGSNGFKVRGASDGFQIGRGGSGAGDVNGDGYADLLLGTNRAAAFAGEAYVIFGGPSGEFIDPTTISSDLKTITWTDVDGDLVTLKFSRGSETVLDPGTIQLLAKSATDNRAQLLSLNLGAGFEGQDVSITAKRMPGGDGKVNVGAISIALADLGKVTVGGDLGQIDAGDFDAVAPFKSLTVGSMGVFGGRTQDTGGNLTSNLFGPAGAVKVAGDVREALLFFGNAGFTGSAASITIGGSLIGGQRAASGAIAGEVLGPVKIGGDLVGGAGSQSGFIQVSASLTSLTLGGSMLGAGGAFSGAVQSFAGVGNLTIGGSQLGGAGDASGAIFTAGSIGKVSIKGDQIGRGLASAIIFANGGDSNIASVTIGGDARGGDALFSGGILAGGTLGPVSIKGDVIGTDAQPYTIRGGGPLTGTTSPAIASVKVGGDFERALILAGYGANNVPVNGRAQIGAISVGGDWIASSITAGLLPFANATGPVGVFGNGDEVFINAGAAGVVASIASITIKGRAVGTLETGDFFGIVAEQIGRVRLGGVKLAFTAANTTDGFFVGPTPDFVIGEVARV